MADKKLIRVFEDIFDVGAEGTVSLVGGLVGDTLIGQIAPGVVSTMLAYKQKRAEKNMEMFMREIKEREQILEERLANLEEKGFCTFREKYMCWAADYALDEIQQEKIAYIVNGLVNIAGHEQIQEDLVLTYYDTLKELRIADIVVLKNYADLVPRSYLDLLSELGITQEQYEAIREKLVRMGLLTTRRDEEFDYFYRNVLEIQEYLTALAKGKKAQLRSLKSLSKSDSYMISQYGRDFLGVFLENPQDS